MGDSFLGFDFKQGLGPRGNMGHGSEFRLREDQKAKIELLRERRSNEQWTSILGDEIATRLA
jgi:hypothetical protein